MKTPLLSWIQAKQRFPSRRLQIQQWDSLASNPPVVAKRSGNQIAGGFQGPNTNKYSTPPAIVCRILQIPMPTIQSVPPTIFGKPTRPTAIPHPTFPKPSSKRSKPLPHCLNRTSQRWHQQRLSSARSWCFAPRSLCKNSEAWKRLKTLQDHTKHEHVGCAECECARPAIISSFCFGQLSAGKSTRRAPAAASFQAIQFLLHNRQLLLYFSPASLLNEKNMWQMWPSELQRKQHELQEFQGCFATRLRQSCVWLSLSCTSTRIHEISMEYKLLGLSSNR